MNNKNNIGIHFVGLTPKETALFERVISFNVTHGLEANIENDATNADLIIVTTELFASIEQSERDHSWMFRLLSNRFAFALSSGVDW